MNFLSHYYTLPTAEKPYEILGVILPDLVKNFSKFHNQNKDESYAKTHLKAMQKGVQLHILGDAIFHQNALFLDFEQIAKEKLEQNKTITIQRKYIVAHILVELLIDQFIIQNNANILTELYQKLDEIDTNQAENFFQKEKNSFYQSNFVENFTKFRKLAFLDYLKENEGLIFTLNKVLGKKFAYNFEVQAKEWNNLIISIKNEIAKDIPMLLNEIKQKLNEQ